MKKRKTVWLLIQRYRRTDMIHIQYIVLLIPRYRRTDVIHIQYIVLLIPRYRRTDVIHIQYIIFSLPGNKAEVSSSSDCGGAVLCVQ